MVLVNKTRHCEAASIQAHAPELVSDCLGLFLISLKCFTSVAKCLYSMNQRIITKLLAMILL
jgi:hypothetical protein